MQLPFVHVELNTKDLEKTKAFYGELCGWEFNDATTEMGPYTTFLQGTLPSGGITTILDAPSPWLPYIGVEDIQAATDKAASLGANVFLRGHEVANVGWLSLLFDPNGTMVGLFQPVKM
ncbi:VOC family protein [Terriglobus saanensis]|uniref:Glyoxalase/bleomycin resistance protein/dioxygenase n=1 Tax=Terriglobus saanensis (strain ATCC BAA-1853 / DSM 23119 / SP1PR4) TaxID=401053 RepID=E8V1P3_TERSS|nr:VOC family protein [Terriglobus saanensis]ADV82324.1 Glyoxalase/bleomycin resistance protein/dioxygenase [Terriglobus saanensis SP1PR4]